MKTVVPLGGATLGGRFVALEPLEERHHAALIAAAATDATIFAHMPIASPSNYAEALERLAQAHARGEMVIYAVRRLSDDAIMGATSYLALSPENARVEIGWTWYAPHAQGGATNPEAKYLLLSNAFAKNWHRVEFKTDSRNARSRAALKKLGATEEGVFRGHMWMPQGYWRDSVYFSIIESDWPRVKAALEKRLAAFDTP